MSEQRICKSSDHLFVPLLEVTIPLLRCVKCNVFAYHNTVKQLAKGRTYMVEDEEPGVIARYSYWRRIWLNLRKNLRLGEV